ncbi:MAG: macro domain-containing protein [Bdellovibrionales bacterium]|nr:macro domain-containing protein [Bdellovibrionales bacterium]
MIRYVSGDILLTEADAIAHGVAPNDHFNQGLAFSLRERWPAMYKDFRHFCKTTHPKEGGAWSWKGVGGPVIVNLLTQEHPEGNDAHPGKASLKHVGHSLKALCKEVEKNELKSIAITKVATGVGGLDWDEVKPLIEDHLAALEIPIFVYENYEKDVKAKEA